MGTILPILGPIITCAAVIGIVFAVRSILKERRRDEFNTKTARIWRFIIILCVPLAILSWLFNMGWLRVILTVSALPLIHTLFFLLVNIKATGCVVTSKTMPKYILLSCASYLLSNFLFPDAGDYGPMYLFFGLIRNDAVASVAMCIAPLMLVFNILILICEYSKLRSFKSENE